MSEEFNKEIQGISKQIDEVSQKLENDYASKRDLSKVADALKAYEQISQKQALKEKKDRIFGDASVAKETVDYMAGVLQRKGLFRDGVFGLTKSGLDTVTANRGQDDFVPTATLDRIEYLLNQGGVARQNATIYSGLRGTLEIPTVTDQVTVAEKVDTDATSFTEVQNTSGTVSLNPRLFGAIYRSSLKLVYESSPAVAALIVEQLTNAMAVKEDQEVIDAIVASSISTISASAVASTDLIDLIDKVHEGVNSADPGVAYFMNRTTWSQIKKLLRNSEANHYMIDFEQGGYSINGVPVVLWHRLPSFGAAATADDFPILYGDMRKAVSLGIGREMSIDIDFGGTENFDKGLATWRLTEDFDAEVVQAGALAAIIDPTS